MKVIVVSRNEGRWHTFLRALRVEVMVEAGWLHHGHVSEMAHDLEKLLKSYKLKC